MNEWSGLRVGYAPYDNTLTRPGDRRRFCYYAAQRGITFEIADPTQRYDLLVVALGADISTWSRYKFSDTKIVFEPIDSYLSDTNLRGKLRGLAKFLSRQNRHLLLDYSQGIRAMCRRADAVVCSTEEQRAQLSKECPNAHIILDFHSEETRVVKTNYERGDTFHLVWEGLGGNLKTFAAIAPLLRELQGKHKIELHAVTDIVYPRYLDGLIRGNTVDLARKLGLRFNLYQWNNASFAAIVTRCDAALIPIDLNSPIYRGKPENKLLLFWRLGMPVVVSATPAYVRAMQAAGTPELACASEQDWRVALTRILEDSSLRRRAANLGKQLTEHDYSTGRTLERWDAVLRSLFQPSQTSRAPIGAGSKA